MTPSKVRLTVTVDPQLVEAGRRSVAAGESDSLSGWVNAALEEKIRRARKLDLLRSAIADYEADLGEITPAEMAAQERADREGAVVVRGPTTNRPGADRPATSAEPV